MGEIGKLAAKWEGSYKVVAKMNNGAYYLQDIASKLLPHPWNILNSGLISINDTP